MTQGALAVGPKQHKQGKSGGAEFLHTQFPENLSLQSADRGNRTVRGPDCRIGWDIGALISTHNARDGGQCK